MVDAVSLPPIQSPRISEVAYDRIKEKIVSKQFPPGSRLNLEAIGKSLGISRTPLKQAVDRLSLEGLITVQPRVGTFVSNPTSDEISQSFDVRRALEVYAVGLAAQRADEENLSDLRRLLDEMNTIAQSPDIEVAYEEYVRVDHTFHREIVSMAGNGRLCQAFERENVHAQMGRIRYRHPERGLDVVHREHEKILSALSSHNVRVARKEMEAHLKRAQLSLLNDLRARDESE